MLLLLKLHKRLDTFKSFESLLLTVNERSFDDIALSLFHFQATQNPLYRHYLESLSVKQKSIKSITEIPYLPISFFKKHRIKTGEWIEKSVYASSGTTGTMPSKHFIWDEEFYLRHAERCFNHFFGKLNAYHFLAFLPSYLERSDSSLIVMMKHFIDKSESPYSDFYLHNQEKLLRDLTILKDDHKKTILWGVSFALLALAEEHALDLSHCIIFETGGMKGRRKEITRQELHGILKSRFNVDVIYSEYGMTELLSQAYSLGDVFHCSPFMKVMAREIGDPFNVGVQNETGILNVIDLANFHSIAFIETEDLGKVHQNNTFEVLGRVDNSDVRGCNLLFT